MEDKKRRKRRYSQTNPPANLNVAVLCVEALEKNEEHILAAIETKVPEDFENDDTYYDWLDRTERALAMTRTERKFLVRWVQEQVPGFVSEKDRRIEEMIEGFHQRAQKMADGIKADCQTRYSANRLPSDLGAAETRMSELSVTTARLNQCFGDLRAEWDSRDLDPDRYRSIKAPLQYLLGMVTAEKALLKRFIQSTREQQITTGEPVPVPWYMDPVREEALRALTSRAQEMAAAIRQGYTRVYSPEHPPSSPDEARTRREYLGGLTTRLDAHLGELRAQGLGHHFSSPQWKAVKAPLIIFREEVKAEISVVRQTIHETYVTDKKFLTELVVRAIANGLHLTLEEQGRFDFILRCGREEGWLSS